LTASRATKIGDKDRRNEDEVGKRCDGVSLAPMRLGTVSGQPYIAYFDSVGRRLV